MTPKRATQAKLWPPIHELTYTSGKRGRQVTCMLDGRLVRKPFPAKEQADCELDDPTLVKVKRDYGRRDKTVLDCHAFWERYTKKFEEPSGQTILAIGAWPTLPDNIDRHQGPAAD